MAMYLHLIVNVDQVKILCNHQLPLFNSQLQRIFRFGVRSAWRGRAVDSTLGLTQKATGTTLRGVGPWIVPTGLTQKAVPLYMFVDTSSTLSTVQSFRSAWTGRARGSILASRMR